MNEIGDFFDWLLFGDLAKQLEEISSKLSPEMFQLLYSSNKVSRFPSLVSISLSCRYLTAFQPGLIGAIDIDVNAPKKKVSEDGVLFLVI